MWFEIIGEIEDVEIIAVDIINMKTQNQRDVKFAMCVSSKDCDDLEPRKIYVVVPDAVSEEEGYFRVVDESGEDYLYPQSNFVSVTLPREAHNAFGIAP